MRKHLRELRRSLYNLFYYFKVIWKDRDWDCDYIDDLILAKFKKAYKFRTTSEWFQSHEGDEKHNQALRVCINILERRRDSWYTEVWWDNQGKYDKTEWIDTDKEHLKQMKITDNASKSVHYKEGYLKRTYDVEERDWRNYCRIVEKWQRYWWD